MEQQTVTVIVGAVTGAALVMGLAVYTKTKQLQSVVDNAEAAASGSAAARTALARQAAGIRDRLGAYGEAQTTRVAEATAEQYMGDVYGITAERVQRLSRLF